MSRAEMHEAIEEIEARDWRYYREVAEQALRDAVMSEGYHGTPQVNIIGGTIQREVTRAIEKIKGTID